MPKPGSLEYFLTERYCLYTVDASFRAQAARDSSLAVAAAGGGGDDRGEHDGRRRRHPAAVDGAAAALREAPGRGRVADDGRG